jgi:Tfp pilus assembly protein PilW
MKKLGRSGLSLAELLVASILVGIVMLGVIGFNFAITTMQNTSSGASVSAVRAAGAMALLRRDIEKAIGDPDNPGILPRAIVDDFMLAIRQENASTPTPGDYTDDQWVCWHHGVSSTLRRCVNPPVFLAGRPNPDPDFSVRDCMTGGGTMAQYCTEITTLSEADYYNVVRNGDGQIEYVELSVSVRPDKDSSADPLNNPETTLTTRVNPTMHSR